jgi:hypothetical protein
MLLAISPFLIKTATGGYGQHFNITANREVGSDNNPYMDKTCTKPQSITIPDTNVRTEKSLNNPLQRSF